IAEVVVENVALATGVSGAGGGAVATHARLETHVELGLVDLDVFLLALGGEVVGVQALAREGDGLAVLEPVGPLAATFEFGGAGSEKHEGREDENLGFHGPVRIPSPRGSSSPKPRKESPSAHPVRCRASG